MLGKCSSLEQEVDSWWLLAVSIFLNNISNYEQETSRSHMSFVICVEWHVPYFVWNVPTCQHVSRHSSPCGNLCSDTASPIRCCQRLGKTHHLHIHSRVFYPEEGRGTFFWSTVKRLHDVTKPMSMLRIFSLKTSKVTYPTSDLRRPVQRVNINLVS